MKATCHNSIFIIKSKIITFFIIIKLLNYCLTILAVEQTVSSIVIFCHYITSSIRHKIFGEQVRCQVFDELDPFHLFDVRNSTNRSTNIFWHILDESYDIIRQADFPLYCTTKNMNLLSILITLFFSYFVTDSHHQKNLGFPLRKFNQN